MKVKTARFVTSAPSLQDCPPDNYPEVAFVGRSNVGKSSLLNTLLHRKKLALTSKTPGKTRTLNYYAINEAFYFVDLPGYGYAAVAKSLKAEWGKSVTEFLKERVSLRLCVQLIDARHKPTALDHQMLELLEEAQVPTLIAATKFDKLKQSERKKSIRRIREELVLPDDVVVVPFSSMTGEGVKEVWNFISECIGR
jgi:GTP-binding protein